LENSPKQLDANWVPVTDERQPRVPHHLPSLSELWHGTACRRSPSYGMAQPDIRLCLRSAPAMLKWLRRQGHVLADGALYPAVPIRLGHSARSEARSRWRACRERLGPQANGCSTRGAQSSSGSFANVSSIALAAEDSLCAAPCRHVHLLGEDPPRPGACGDGCAAASIVSRTGAHPLLEAVQRLSRPHQLAPAIDPVSRCPGTPKVYHLGTPESVPPHGLKKP
jgi:hypothetical protein